MGRDTWGLDVAPDQSDRTVVVTGANSGIGFEATKALAEMGATVVMACRDLDRGRDAREEIRESVEAGTLALKELDLADLSSIRSFADDVRDEYPSVDVLCNNAGVMAIPRSETADGFETQFGVNHLGHFALTGRLLDHLRASDGDARVVTQSSGLHENGDLDFEDLQGEADYDPWDAYAQSKLANLLFAYELDRRLGAADADVHSIGCHPGYAATNLQFRGPEARGSRVRYWLMRAANAVLAQSAAKGALPMLFAATAADVEGGDYVGPGGIMNMRGAPTVQESSGRSHDADLARRLWDVSRELTGVTYDIPPADRQERRSS